MLDLIGEEEVGHWPSWRWRREEVLYAWQSGWEVGEGGRADGGQEEEGWDVSNCDVMIGFVKRARILWNSFGRLTQI